MINNSTAEYNRSVIQGMRAKLKKIVDGFDT